jgi:ABC-type antimicrobial peptide transport system permease subunit
MAKKKNNLISIIPAFLIMGAAIGIQTANILRDAAIGLIVGIIVYFFLRYRNKRINNNK